MAQVRNTFEKSLRCSCPGHGRLAASALACSRSSSLFVLPDLEMSKRAISSGTLLSAVCRADANPYCEADPVATQAHVAAQDEGQAIIVTLVMIVVAAGLLAIGIELSLPRMSTASPKSRGSSLPCRW